VAERSSLVRLQREWDVAVEWVGYELHPETPRGGLALADYLPDAQAMLRYVREFAARFGIHDMRPPERLANTRRALAVAQRARALGRLDPYRAAAFDHYWREGRGLEGDEDLKAIARAAALDEALALAAAEDPAALAEVDAARRRARDEGVTGIPTFDFVPEAVTRAQRVVGCQPYEVLVESARRAGARRREGQA
jgi:predicted DsbA family dithiol-disulfide isomerase